jgi:hypothetical protein
MLTMTVQTAWAETATTYYVDATGTRHENFTATVLTGGEATTLSAGWYVVNSDITYTGTVTITGDVTIILGNGCTMNIGTSEVPVEVYGIYDHEYSSLTIYGQTLDETTAGQLRIYNSSFNPSIGIFLNGTYTQNSGNVTINSYGNAIYVSNSLTINGGKLDATASTLWQWGSSKDVFALAGSNITMTGGILNATGNQDNGANSAYGIACQTFTLGWRNASDRFTASSFYRGTVTIADGQAFTTDGTDIYSGTLSSDDLAAIAGKTLVPYDMTVVAKPATVGGQTNYWTTLYRGIAGFAIDAEENACAYTATVSGTEITLHRLGKVIPKGTAVIIVGEDESISMTVSEAAAEYTVDNDLHGVDVATPLSSVMSTYSADAILVLSNKNGNFGFHELATTNVPARKAFLAINDPTGAREFTMVFEDATEIRSIDNGELTTDNLAGAWYSLDGRRLSGKPTKSGIYVKNGHKIIIK